MGTINAVAFREMDFTNHYRARFGSYGRTYADYEFAYRFGYELAVNPSLDGEVWLVIEMQARRTWKEQYPDSQWLEYRDAVRFAWQMTRNAMIYR
jgi:hypothetical protein